MQLYGWNARRVQNLHFTDGFGFRMAWFDRMEGAVKDENT